MFRIGYVKIDSLKNEEVYFSNEVTSKAVEDGSDITDNIKHEPQKISVTCVVAGNDANIRYSLLKMMSNQDSLVTYYGSLEPVLHNMAIESVSNKRDVTFGNGFEFDVSLVQVNIATAKTFLFVSQQASDPVTGNKVEGKPQNAGKKQIKSQTVAAASLRMDAMRRKVNEIM